MTQIVGHRVPGVEHYQVVIKGHLWDQDATMTWDQAVRVAKVRAYYSDEVEIIGRTSQLTPWHARQS
jgi:hypothetical protein